MTDQKDSVAFPVLTDVEFASLREIGVERDFVDGDILFQSGDRDFSFFAITAGECVVLESSHGLDREVTTHQVGEFTGDVAMLTGRPAIVTIRARGTCTAIEISSSQVRRMLADVPELSDKLLEAFQMRRRLLEASGFLGIRVVGRSNCKRTLQIQEFFYKNKVPYTFQDIAEDQGKSALAAFDCAEDDTPVIACGDSVIKQPSLGTVAECLGISRRIKEELYDVLVVGAGPAGLAAAVYGASEGLKTLVVDGIGPGGQAGQSSKIENYMGFPSGLPGAELANRGYLQALKFGAEFTAPVMVRSMHRVDDGSYSVTLCTGQSVSTKTVLIATGASYRRLPVENCERLEGSGIYYSATSVEARACRDSTAIVVGGGNSAGQAAVFLAQSSGQVKLLIRGADIRKSMSDYLAKRIENSNKIEICTHTEIAELKGDDRLQLVRLRDNQSGDHSQVQCAAVFVFVGAKPHTDWLPGSIASDKDGFVLTGPTIQDREEWMSDRTPCELETTWPGVFAAGDVRSGTTKRCAFAAGDGALAVTCVHQYLSREKA